MKYFKQELTEAAALTWKGDFDAMIQRRVIRVLVAPSRTSPSLYFQHLHILRRIYSARGAESTTTERAQPTLAACIAQDHAV